MGGISENEALRIGEAVRAACVRAALDAYERASMDGLCDEGALEVAMDAVRGVDVRRVVEALGRQSGEG
jgi:hypothetical protein